MARRRFCIFLVPQDNAQGEPDTDDSGNCVENTSVSVACSCCRGFTHTRVGPRWLVERFAVFWFRRTTHKVYRIQMIKGKCVGDYQCVRVRCDRFTEGENTCAFGGRGIGDAAPYGSAGGCDCTCKFSSSPPQRFPMPCGSAHIPCPAP